MLPNWETSSRDIVERIRATKSPLKILLKTKNEKLFLDGWIAHHEKIVGRENLIIADNGSDDPEVLEYLYKIKDDHIVFQFEGLHNRLHRPSYFGELYGALEDVSDYFVPCDTDERLVWIEGDEWIADARLIQYVQREGEFSALPGILINNKPRSMVDFDVPLADGQKNIVLFGKPIVNTKSFGSTGKQTPLHNVQFPKGFYKRQQRIGLFHLHLINYSPEQRLRVNRDKLIAHGFVDPQIDYAGIAALDLGSTAGQPGIRRLVSETRRALRDLNTDDQSQKRERCMSLQPDGTLSFSDPATEADFRALVETGTDMLFARFAELEA